MINHTFRMKHKLEGVLTAATSVTLSDSTATYGIKRTDTGAILVAAGTATSNPSTGIYEYELTNLVSGVNYSCWFKVTYDGTTNYFEVEFTASDTSSNLCTRQQVKDSVDITGTADDTKIDLLIAAASQAIMREYEREFVPQTNATARTFVVKNRLVDLTPFDLRSITTVKLNSQLASPNTLVASTGYVLLPIGGRQKTGTFTELKLAEDVSLYSTYFNRFGHTQIEITGNWGIWDSAASVAEDVNRAAIETVLSWLDRPSESVSGIDEFGNIRQQLPSVAKGWTIPSSAHAKLKLYQRSIIKVF